MCNSGYKTQYITKLIMRCWVRLQVHKICTGTCYISQVTAMCTLNSLYPIKLYPSQSTSMMTSIWKVSVSLECTPPSSHPRFLSLSPANGKFRILFFMKIQLQHINFKLFFTESNFFYLFILFSVFVNCEPHFSCFLHMSSMPHLAGRHSISGVVSLTQNQNLYFYGWLTVAWWEIKL